MTNHCIYYVRSGPNEELRYSLRTLAVNGPGDVQVSIIGDPPEWVDRDKVQVVPGNPYHEAGANSYHNLVVANTLEPGDYWSFNDDFFILRSWPDPFPVWYWRSLEHHMIHSMRDPRSAVRRDRFRITLEHLRSKGIQDPNHYELHIPMKINGERMQGILDDARETINEQHPPIWRTLYGNLGAEGEHRQRDDVKFHLASMVPEGIDFLSTDEKTFRSTSKLLTEYTEPSPWEKS